MSADWGLNAVSNIEYWVQPWSPRQQCCQIVALRITAKIELPRCGSNGCDGLAHQSNSVTPGRKAYVCSYSPLCKLMAAITTTVERTDDWTKMRRPFAPFSGPETSHHTRFSAGFITIMCGFRFTVHMGLNHCCDTSIRRPASSIRPDMIGRDSRRCDRYHRPTGRKSLMVTPAGVNRLPYRATVRQ